MENKTRKKGKTGKANKANSVSKTTKSKSASKSSKSNKLSKNDKSGNTSKTIKWNDVRQTGKSRNASKNNKRNQENRSSIISIIKNYINRLQKVYPLYNIIIISVVILVTILTLDILNKPSEIIGNIDNTILIVSVVGTVFIAIICIAHHKVFSNLKLSNINYTDCIITYVFVTSFFGFIAWIILDGFLCYKTLGALFIFITSSILLVVRALTLHNINNKISTTNLFDLKDICEGKFKVAPNQPILLSEKDVDYDLLRRNGIITLLKKNITSYTANRSFVIGLVGEWGSGKTTIINNVKKDLKPKNKSIILIDDFDPWIFGTQETLLAAMYENILKHTEIKVSISQNNSIMRILSQTVSELSSTALNVSAINTIIGILSNTNSTYENADILKELIGDFLISQRKTVVFIIDNLDRADSENIILLFKVMGTIFDIPNIIYFLSYEKKELRIF